MKTPVGWIQCIGKAMSLRVDSRPNSGSTRCSFPADALLGTGIYWGIDEQNVQFARKRNNNFPSRAADALF
jgi:hypothetical protein